MSNSRSPQPAGRGHSNDLHRDPSLDRHALGPSARPGPLGTERHSSPERWHPPLSFPPESDTWHPPLAEGASLRSQLELSDGEDELSMLREVYGNVLNESGKRAYAHFGDGGWAYRTDEYLEQRDTFFGGAARYAAYKQMARSELDANGAKLRGKVDPQVEQRPMLRRWREAQVCFYAWTRRAYENVLGSAANIPAIISAGTSEKLRSALKQVQADYGQSFPFGGFNPRPIKTPRGYRLGTISDHAFGTAIDIRAPMNAQIEDAEWQGILSFTGKALDTATRKAMWKASPEALHIAIVGINDSFVGKLQAAIAVETTAGQSDAATLAAVVKADAHLTQLGTRFVTRWRRGFFELPWALIKELHEEGFVWGAIFSRLDLHHFELH